MLISDKAVHTHFRRILLLVAAATAVVAYRRRLVSIRGPGGSGVSSETGLPAEWSASKGVAWKSQLPGFGASSPWVFGQPRLRHVAIRDYGLSQDNPGDATNAERHVVCYDLEHRAKVWDTPFPHKQ